MRSELCAMRAQLRAALPERAFLRRDRSDGLFISNAPAFGWSPSPIPGFAAEEQGMLLRILPDGESIVRMEEGKSPPDDLSRSLARFRGQECSREALVLFARGMKLIDMGASAPEAETETFERALRQRAALALRGACSGGGLYAAALVNHEIRKGE